MASKEGKLGLEDVVNVRIMIAKLWIQYVIQVQYGYTKCQIQTGGKVQSACETDCKQSAMILHCRAE